MNRGLSLIGGVGLGAGLMYFFDPQLGRRRRAVLRDRLTSLLRQTGGVVCDRARDLRNRGSGLLAEARSRLAPEEVSDDVLVERVRSQVGRVVSHPRALDVRAEGGRVVLSGPVLADEVEDLLCCVESVRGVRGVENRLDVRREAGNVPALQGGR